MLGYLNTFTVASEHPSAHGKKLLESPWVLGAADHGPNLTEDHEISAFGESLFRFLFLPQLMFLFLLDRFDISSTICSRSLTYSILHSRMIIYVEGVFHLGFFRQFDFVYVQ